VKLGLEGKKGIVTGGSKGLGFAIASELVQEGAEVAICSRDEEEVRAAAAEIGAAHAQAADVTDPAQVADLVARSADALGGIDFLVNNAGGAHPGSFAQLTDEDWIADLDVKLLALIRCSREVLPHMRTRGGGRIVNIGAIQAKAPDPAFFATSVNRAAGNSFTKTLALEVARDNVLVNGVNIGYVVTPQWDNIARRRAPGDDPQAFFERLARQEVPLGRFGTAEEVAGIVVFLLSERASFITGTAIDVAGGMGRYV
jgi:NAD(P)-dependent dehydrogenase (short-subunit alcohol dehydrogenase family)